MLNRYSAVTNISFVPLDQADDGGSNKTDWREEETAEFYFFSHSCNKTTNTSGINIVKKKYYFQAPHSI